MSHICKQLLYVSHTYLTMFLTLYHHDIFRNDYHLQKQEDCKRSWAGAKGQGHRCDDPTWPFLDCNSSLNSLMATKFCTKLELAWNMCPIDNTDVAILQICEAIKVDPPVQPTDIAVSHRLGRPTEGKTRQVIVKFATRNVRERVYSAKKELKNVRDQENMSYKLSNS